MTGVSVIICCYNSGKRIGETLSHLTWQILPSGFSWEVIVVNNNSTDDTVQKVMEFQHSGLPIRLVHESEPGLARARMRGVRETRFDLIVFCDDDNHLGLNYIATAARILRDKPTVGILGGKIKPKFPFYPGKWIEPNYAALAIGGKASEGYTSWVFGAGMVVRKVVFEDLERRGSRLLLSGRVGKNNSSGDDAELCTLTRLMGYEIYYSPTLELDHAISAHRLSRKDFITRNYKNVNSPIVFFIMDALVHSKDVSGSSVYWSFLKSAVRNVLHYVPRIFIGKANFFSFMVVYLNMQLFIWLALNQRSFNETFQVVKRNLFPNDC